MLQLPITVDMCEPKAERRRFERQGLEWRIWQGNWRGSGPPKFDAKSADSGCAQRTVLLYSIAIAGPQQGWRGSTEPNGRLETDLEEREKIWIKTTNLSRDSSSVGILDAARRREGLERRHATFPDVGTRYKTEMKSQSQAI